MNFSGSIKINKCGLLILTLFGILLFYYVIFSSFGLSHSQRQYTYIFRNPNDVNLRKLLIGGIQAAQMGGIEVKAVSQDIQAKSKGKTNEGANDPVTNADLRSHCVMKHGLKRLFPRVRIISEEDTEPKECSRFNPFELDPTVIDEDIQLPDDHILSADDVTVWIDPLDATQEYTESLFQYVTTMVCIALRGEPIIGIIHNPFTKETTWAWKDVAVSEKLNKIRDERPSPMAATKNPKIIVSRSHKGKVNDFIGAIFGEKTPVITAAGAGYKVLQVIFNNATAYMHVTDIKKWDLCAGSAILSSVGGKMTTLENKAIGFSAIDSNLVTEGVLATLRNHKYYATRIHDYQTQLKFRKQT